MIAGVVTLVIAALAAGDVTLFVRWREAAREAGYLRRWIDTHPHGAARSPVVPAPEEWR